MGPALISLRGSVLSRQKKKKKIQKTLNKKGFTNE